ncbi:MAG TPA: sugar ABC transporter permease [Longimicrobiaceae bacterium]|nr:sugar ABC transporter permease [Longimicrobiaceae bacterium]
MSDAGSAAGTAAVAAGTPPAAGAAVLARRRRLRVPGEGNPAAYGFLAPALALIFVFFFIPVVAALALSFTDFDLYAVGDLSNARWVGLRNYQQLLHTPLFWQALRNTFYFALVGGPLSIAVSLAAALLLNQKLLRLKGFFRTVYFAPFVTTLVAVAIVWGYLFHARYGLLNYVLGVVGVGPIDWLGDPHWAMPAIILMTVWKSFGYNMLIFIAGLQAIPEELLEAARIDGATALQRFRHVTLPQLAPTLLFVTVITMIGFFQLFVEPYVMTGGGPLRSTTSVVLLMYEEGFRWWRIGYAAAVAFVLFLVILAATLLQVAVQRRVTAR